MKNEHDQDFDSLIEFIGKGQRFTLLTHISPDGDTLGSALATYMLLVKLGKCAEVVCSNPVPKIYSFLPHAGSVKLPEHAEGYENVLSIDCADTPRFGRAIRMFNAAEATAAIDHHITNPYFAGTNLVIPDASATAEIIHELYLRMDMPIDVEVAACLYTGIVTDTGNLTYSNTTPNAVRIIADFLEMGLDITELNRRIYRTIPYSKARIQGFVASRMQLEHGGDIGIAVLTRAQLLDFGATNEDCEGIVDCVRDVDCVKIAVFIREGADGTYKVSLRSKSIGDVGRIANAHGGGGHERAAGYTASEPLTTVIANAIDEAVRELNRSSEE
ncbi:MAG: bifunctional oligoribonuclease/PAP phosphatase NrnA [Christensenellaceae bacterium]|nr:bifunctional oligoribonuclease/PAP phosphatase NrnA [Christensenellaceae bacterium]